MVKSARQLAHGASELFVESFGHHPQSLVVAPGRVNLIGGHVDYNDGIVLPLAIDRHTVLAGRMNQTRVIRFVSSQFPGSELRIALDQILQPKQGNWGDYLRGVIASFQELGMHPPGMEVAIVSNIPIGSGLSSSAALLVGLATLLEDLLAVSLDPREKALLCQNAEHRFAGVPCGIMDPFTSVFGRADHLLKIDCQSQRVDWIPWDSRQVSIVILDTHTRHQLAESQYASRRQCCRQARQKLGQTSYRNIQTATLDRQRSRLEDCEFRCARHVVSELPRCRIAEQAIRDRDWILAGQQMFAGHLSLRDDFQVSCAELDFLVDQATRIGPRGGMFGMRMTGGGFGGCTVAVVQSTRIDDVTSKMTEAFQGRFQRVPGVIVTHPVAGARRIPLQH